MSDMKKLKIKLRRFLESDKGLTTVEYAVAGTLMD